MSEVSKRPICIDCGEVIDERTCEWFNEKRGKLGKDEKMPKRCGKCVYKAIREMLAKDLKFL